MHSGFIVAVSVLTTVFCGTLLVLIVVVRKRFCRTFELLSSYCNHNDAPDQNLLENTEIAPESTSEVELNEVASRNGESCDGDAWRSSVVDLMPHCLGILKAAHLLTDNIVKQALIESKKVHLPEALTDLVPLANTIGIKVDEVVKSMYPPFDPRLLEARCSALVFSVKNVILLVESAFVCVGSMGWVSQVMMEVEEHLKILREASIAYEKRLSPVVAMAMKEVEEEDELIDIETQPCKVTSSSV